MVRRVPMVDAHAAELLVVQAQARCAFPFLDVAISQSKFSSNIIAPSSYYDPQKLLLLLSVGTWVALWELERYYSLLGLVHALLLDFI